MNTSPSRCRHLHRIAAGVLATVALATVCRAAAAIEPLASIRQAAQRFVAAQMPTGEVGIVVRAARLDSRVRLARCAGPLAASLLSGSQLQSNDTVAVRCRRGAHWTIYVPVRVQARLRLWALRAPEPQGARLTPADLAPVTRLVSGMVAGYVTDLAVLAHSTLREPLPAGALLETRDLRQDFVVRHGQRVTLVAAIDGIRVHASGVALEDGRYGELIRVENRSSHKVLQGTVGSGHVVYVTP